MAKMHNNWNSNNMAMEPCIDGKSKIEINVSLTVEQLDGCSD